MWGNRTTIAFAERDVRTSADSTDVPQNEQLGLIPVAAQGGSVVDLGNFDEGFDGWHTDGAAALSRVERSVPGEVDSTGPTLRIDAGGDLAPTILTEQPIRDVDLRRHSSLTATVMAGSLSNTDAPVQFRFRLVHDAHLRGRGRSSTERARSGNTAHDGRTAGASSSESALTSETFRAPQDQPIRLSWDLSTVDETVLDSAVRLELQCERADRPVSEGPYGAGADGVRGPIFVEDVVLTDSPDAIAAAELQRHWLRLETAHGPHRDTVTEYRTDDTESGQFVFGDGTHADYQFERQASGPQLFTLAGDTYVFEDGMAAVEMR